MDTQTRKQRGFTLYELLMTILVVGVVLTVGIPNMTAFTQNSRMTATANDIHAAFLMARSEAARSRASVTICASDNAMDADAGCGGTWADGFIVFQDPNFDGARDVANEALLRSSPAIAEGVTLRIADNAGYFMYAPTGLGRQDAGGNTTVSQIVMCDDRGNEPVTGEDSAARLFVATPIGRANITRDVDEIEQALDDMGVTCP